jgi:hypothetical protein
MEGQSDIDMPISNLFQVKDIIIGEIRLTWGELLGGDGYHFDIRHIVMNHLPVHMSAHLTDTRVSMYIGKA